MKTNTMQKTLIERVQASVTGPVRAALIAAGLALASQGAAASELQTLKNMERERAQLVASFIDPELEPQNRQAAIASKQKRLVDLERMVLRDDALLGNTDRMVQFAFNSYDLSFLVHASAEAKQMPIAHWLDQVGFSHDDIAATKIGRR